MSRYLVTGASGFLGSVLVRELGARGAELVLVDKNILGNGFFAHQILEVDLSITESTQTVLEAGPFDAIFHLASEIDFNVKKQSDLFLNNVASTKVVSEIARLSGCKKLIFTSSNAIYLGSAGDRLIKEADTPTPVDEYGRSKVASEAILASYAEDFDSVIFRCPNILDAGRVGMLSIFFDFVIEGRRCWLIGEGSSRHQCLYSGDLVTAMLDSLSLSGSHTFNIGSSNVPAINEMYQAVIDRANTGAKIGNLPAFIAIPILKLLNRLHLSPIGPYQFRMLTEDFMYDCSRVESTLNWRPTLNNTEMLCKAFDFYRENRNELVRNRSANSGRVSQGLIGLVRRLS